MSRVDPRQLEQWKEAFSCFADPHLPAGQGTISTQDLGQLIRALGKSPTQEDLQKLYAEVDPKGDGVDFNGFCACMARNLKAPETEAEVLEAFKAFDKDHSGTIASNEFQTVMRNFGEALNDDEVDKLIDAASSCEVQKGVIDYRRFCKILLA
eukprot:CAMPEP_0184311468 /NCGR_PEP_ID=MMETSP1049-20130417/41926_1 /TAXON_ID=77928 /ORGANISM="Proteomonas sulcata, Strain CCMP704" /LENGTH=152 /DNA_ID=CAMNT_0026626865 /DNA_START=83 /DNA_END=541 /DNA_ORIENTATION=+